MSLYVDGSLQVDRVPFKAGAPIRHAAFYNWRSGARAAFSELALGDECPYPIDAGPGREPADGGPRGLLPRGRCLCLIPTWMLVAFAVVLLSAVARWDGYGL